MCGMSKDANGDIRVSPCLKWFLFSVNFLFWVVSILLVLNALYQRESSGLENFVSTTIQMKEKKSMNKVETAFADIIVSLSDFSLTFLCVGGILFAVTFVGFLGALRENRCLLLIYDSLLAILITAKAVGMVYFYYQLTKSKPEDIMRGIIQLYVENYNRDYRVDLIVDWAQSEFECCGTRVNGETNSWNIWHLHPDFECRKDNTQPFYCSVPPSCCKKGTDVVNYLCGKDVITIGDGLQRPRADGIVPEEPTTRAYRNIYTQDCAVKMGNFVSDYLLIISAILASLMAAQLFALCAGETLKDQIMKCRAAYEEDTAQLRQQMRVVRRPTSSRRRRKAETSRHVTLNRYNCDQFPTNVTTYI